jgi:hypothetical protein
LTASGQRSDIRETDRGDGMSVGQAQTVLDKIRTRGNWRVVIRPTTFEERHVPKYADLFPIIQKCSVQVRGWGYPRVDHRNPPLRGSDWVGQEADWDYFLETWRLYLSGQFIRSFAISGDWRDQSNNWPADNGWAPGRYLYYIDTVYEFVEIFEFAARLALSAVGAPSMRVEVQLHGLQGRRLVSTDIMVCLSGDYVTQMPDWNHRWEGSQTDLIARPRELAAEAVQELFARFGFDVSSETLAKVQARIGR